MSLPEVSNSGVAQATVEQLQRYYQNAAARIAAIVTEPGNSPAKLARAQQLSAQIDEIQRQLKTQAAKWTGSAIANAMAGGIARADQQAAAVGLDVDPVSIRGSFALIDHGAAQQFALDTAKDLYKAADNMGERAKRVLRATAQRGLGEDEINTILAGGVISGEPAETIHHLREALQAVHGEKVPIQTSAGIREYDVGYYAQMVARTKTRQATVQSRHDRLQTLGIDLVSIIGRVSVNWCTAYLGQVYSISGKSDKYPALDDLPSDGPPFHPNCSKSTRPFIEELATDRELSFAQGHDDQDAMLGIDPSQAAKRFQSLGLYDKVKKTYGAAYGGTK
jgi:hypothetical protein